LIQTTGRIEHLDRHTLNVFVDGELPLGEQEGIRPHVEHCRLCALYAFSTKELKAAIVRAGLRSDPHTTAIAKANHAGDGNLVYFDSQPTLRAAVNRLLPILCEVLLLCDVEELSYRDIALVRDIPISTMMSRISDARDALCQLPILQHRKSQ
jgi:hypothetical protein